jgi:hypothetical protein
LCALETCIQLSNLINMAAGDGVHAKSQAGWPAVDERDLAGGSSANAAITAPTATPQAR